VQKWEYLLTTDEKVHLLLLNGNGFLLLYRFLQLSWRITSRTVVYVWSVAGGEC